MELNLMDTSSLNNEDIPLFDEGIRFLTEEEQKLMYDRLNSANQAAQYLPCSYVDFPISESENMVFRFDNSELINPDHPYLHFGKLRLIVV